MNEAHYKWVTYPYLSQQFFVFIFSRKLGLKPLIMWGRERRLASCTGRKITPSITVYWWRTASLWRGLGSRNVSGQLSRQPVSYTLHFFEIWKGSHSCRNLDCYLWQIFCWFTFLVLGVEKETYGGEGVSSYSLLYNTFKS